MNESKYLELLTATISHELMTPLNAIMTLTSYLMRKFDAAADSVSEVGKKSYSDYKYLISII
jgi:signal transduction histidine kinase